MKTRAGYWISGVLIVVAVVGVFAWVAGSISDMTDKVDAFSRVSPGDTDTVQLEAKKYVIYYEGEDAETYTPSLAVTVTDENGVALPTPLYTSELTYSFGGHEGTAQQTVTPLRAGEYTIRVANAYDGESGTGVAIGESLSESLLRTIFGAIVIGAIFGLTGIALLATTIVRRHNARKPRYPPGPPAVFVPPGFVPGPPYGQAGQETPYGQETSRDPPPPPYGQTPSA